MSEVLGAVLCHHSYSITGCLHTMREVLGDENIILYESRESKGEILTLQFWIFILTCLTGADLSQMHFSMGWIKYSWYLSALELANSSRSSNTHRAHCLCEGGLSSPCEHWQKCNYHYVIIMLCNVLSAYTYKHAGKSWKKLVEEGE